VLCSSASCDPDARRAAELIEARMYYDWKPDQLMEEAVRSSESRLSSVSCRILTVSSS
jgi:hypothetical protein